MNDIIWFVLAFMIGMGLGVVYFGGLWITVQKAVNAEIPALWIFGSFVLRISIILMGLYLIGAGNWQRLVLCLLGFIAARLIVIRVSKTWSATPPHLKNNGL